MNTVMIGDSLEAPPILWGVVLFLLFLVWLVASALIALRGDDVDKPNRVAQFYGYTVCLVALVISLTSLSSILSNLFQRANPLQSEMSFGVQLTSFEGYKASIAREGMFPRNSQTAPDTTSEATLRKRYDALVADRVAETRYQTSKALTTSSIFLVIAIVLFGTHWRWILRLGNAPAA